MLTVHATLLPNGQVQLPPGLAKARPVPVLVTILEPMNDAGQPEPESTHEAQDASTVSTSGAAAAPGIAAPATTGKGSVANLLALLASPQFQALPKSDPQEVEERIQALRNDWDHD
ncbi:MAG: hypothetical protein RLY71_2183 [Pseudomonadota bacterium]|jgi:hypothetical protein